MTKAQKLRLALAKFDARALLAAHVPPFMVEQTKQKLADELAKLEDPSKSS